MIIKIRTSILIFLILFIVASYLNHLLKREFYVPGVDEVVDILPVEMDFEGEENKQERVKIFLPREYVRLRSVL